MWCCLSDTAAVQCPSDSRSAGKSLTNINPEAGCCSSRSQSTQSDAQLLRQMMNVTVFIDLTSLRCFGGKCCVHSSSNNSQYISASLRGATSNKMLFFSYCRHSFKQATVVSFCGCHQSWCSHRTIQSPTISALTASVNRTLTFWPRNYFFNFRTPCI